MFDLLIKNGTAVLFDITKKCDIGIIDGKIVSIGDSSTWTSAKRVIDAEGKIVVPGMLDSHAHIASPGAFPSIDNYQNGTIAAAYGGTTTIVDFAFVCDGETPRIALNRKIRQARNNCYIDYAFHSCINKADAVSFEEISELLDEGYSSVKMFTTYRNSLMLEAAGVYKVFQMIAAKGGIAMVHAEHAELIEYFTNLDIAAGKTSVRYHPQSRPVITEVTAFAEVIEMARQTGSPVLFAHMTTGKTNALLKNAKEDGLPIFTETCPHYLILDESVYERTDGCKFVCNPPIRGKEDRDSLWELVKNGTVRIVNSDHTDFSFAQKVANNSFYPGIPGGLPGIECRGMMLFSEGVATGKISLERFVELTSTNIAKLMGLYPQKGTIQIGSDADIAIIDPTYRSVNHVRQMHMQTDYSPYENMTVIGAVTDTIVRGNIIIENGMFSGIEPIGVQLKRHCPELV